jgi:hypothetical protein
LRLSPRELSSTLACPDGSTRLFYHITIILPHKFPYNYHRITIQLPYNYHIYIYYYYILPYNSKITIYILLYSHILPFYFGRDELPFANDFYWGNRRRETGRSWRRVSVVCLVSIVGLDDVYQYNQYKVVPPNDSAQMVHITPISLCFL